LREQISQSTGQGGKTDGETSDKCALCKMLGNEGFAQAASAFEQDIFATVYKV
jgi:hypothetical protein